MQFHGPSPLPSRQLLADASLRGGTVDASRDASPPGAGSDAPSGQSGERLAFTDIRAGASGIDLAPKADAMFVTAESEPAAGSATPQADLNWLRFVLEGGRGFSVLETATLHPSQELGVRHGGGDAVTGAGLEDDGGVAHADVASGLSKEAKLRLLVAHAGCAGAGIGRGCVSASAGPGAGGGLRAFTVRRPLHGHAQHRLADAPVVPGAPGLEVSLDTTRRETADDIGSSGNAEHGMTLGGLIH